MSKLTLSVDKAIIEAAKKYAKGKNTSLSRIIENYLQKIISDTQSEEEQTPIVDKLSGSISLPDNFDYKEDYTDHLIQKYK